MFHVGFQHLIPPKIIIFHIPQNPDPFAWIGSIGIWFSLNKQKSKTDEGSALYEQHLLTQC